MVFLLEFQSNSRRQSGDAEGVFGDRLKPERGLIIDEHHQASVYYANGCLGSFHQRRKRLTDDEHRHELAGDPEIAGPATQLRLGGGRRIRGHRNAFGAAPGNEVLGEQTEHEIIDEDVNDHVHAYQLAVIFYRMNTREVAVPQLAGFPAHAAPFNDEGYVRMRLNRDMKADESELEIGMEIEMILDVSARRKKEQPDDFFRALNP